MNKYTELPCAVCAAGAPPVADEILKDFLVTYSEWKKVIEHDAPILERVYKLADFQTAIDFAVKIGEIAEQEGHHPALLVEWGKVTVRWWTHKINNIHDNDLIMAAKTEGIYKKMLG